MAKGTAKMPMGKTGGTKMPPKKGKCQMDYKEQKWEELNKHLTKEVNHTKINIDERAEMIQALIMIAQGKKILDRIANRQP